MDEHFVRNGKWFENNERCTALPKISSKESLLAYIASIDNSWRLDIKLIVGITRDGSESLSFAKWSARACTCRALSGCLESESENDAYLFVLRSRTEEYKKGSTILYIRRQTNLRDQRAFGHCTIAKICMRSSSGRNGRRLPCDGSGRVSFILKESGMVVEFQVKALSKAIENGSSK